MTPRRRIPAGSQPRHWHGAIVTSPRLTELIETRLGRLDTVVLELLEILALAEPVDVQLLESLADPLVLAAAADR
jgi:hypothetical protein